MTVGRGEAGPRPRSFRDCGGWGGNHRSETRPTRRSSLPKRAPSQVISNRIWKGNGKSRYSRVGLTTQVWMRCVVKWVPAILVLTRLLLHVGLMRRGLDYSLQLLVFLGVPLTCLPGRRHLLVALEVKDRSADPNASTPPGTRSKNPSVSLPIYTLVCRGTMRSASFPFPACTCISYVHESPVTHHFRVPPRYSFATNTAIFEALERENA